MGRFHFVVCFTADPLSPLSLRERVGVRGFEKLRL
jgi:hypothetical protein